MNNRIFDVFLEDAKLKDAEETAVYTPLTGGVSSDIYKVDLPGRSICIKRALPKLKVSADWEAPTSRSDFEWRWISFVGTVLPKQVPVALAHDESSGLFAMSFLNEAQHPVWKNELLGGRVDPGFAGIVGQTIGQIHAASSRNDQIPTNFASDSNFFALRLEPYLLATAKRHADVAAMLEQLAATTASTKLVLVHGDVSPKNILIGPAGPVILDAECAWFGDPAFDLAFCLNHLLLKAMCRPDQVELLRRSFDNLHAAYLSTVSWEPVADLERRAAQLLPTLMLARVDGKSPVEYVSVEADKDRIRNFSKREISLDEGNLKNISERWYSTF